MKSISRRGLLKMGAALAAAPTVVRVAGAAQRSTTRQDGGTLEPASRAPVNPERHILLRGGTVITCVIDNSHNSRSAAHSDAAVEALFDSGIRAVHASGPPQFGTWDNQWPADLARLQKKYFTSDDQLVTLRAFANPNRDNWAFARSLGLKIHADGISSELVETFAIRRTVRAG